jgi:hypothetical protein
MADAFVTRRRVSVVGVIVLCVIGGLFYNVGWHHIDAAARLSNPPTGPACGEFLKCPGSQYVANVVVHMGHPVDVSCYVEALDANGNMAADATFTLPQANGSYNQSGDLDIHSAVQVNENLRITCHVM